MMNPDISFDIDLPTADGETKSRVRSVLYVSDQQENIQELNKQVISDNTLDSSPEEEDIEEIRGGGVLSYNALPTLNYNFIKDNDGSLEVMGLFIEGENFPAEQYKKIADLPSKEELLTKFVIGLNSPMTKVVTIMNATMVKMVTALNAVKEKKE